MENCARRWQQLHERYAVCTGLALDELLTRSYPFARVDEAYDALERSPCGN